MLAEEYNMPGWARATLAGYLGCCFVFAFGNQGQDTGIWRLQVHCPATSASHGHELKALTGVVACRGGV